MAVTVAITVHQTTLLSVCAFLSQNAPRQAGTFLNKVLGCTPVRQISIFVILYADIVTVIFPAETLRM